MSDGLSWFIRRPDEAAITAEIDNQAQPDRVLAIVAVAFLNDRLTTLIADRFRRDKKVVRALFDGSAPLGTFFRSRAP